MLTERRADVVLGLKLDWQHLAMQVASSIGKLDVKDAAVIGVCDAANEIAEEELSDAVQSQ